MTDTNTEKKQLFETMAVPKALATMAVPTIISQLVNLVYNMVDTIYIGMTGDAYKTAAVTLVFTIFMMTVSFSNLFGIGGGSLIARLIGIGSGGRCEKGVRVQLLLVQSASRWLILRSSGRWKIPSCICSAPRRPRLISPGSTFGSSSFSATCPSSSP
jgi:hypothetical protein